MGQAGEKYRRGLAQGGLEVAAEPRRWAVGRGRGVALAQDVVEGVDAHRHLVEVAAQGYGVNHLAVGAAVDDYGVTHGRRPG